MHCADSNAESLPDTNLLLLIGQMMTPGKVVGLNCVNVRSKEILSASRWGKVFVVARVLADLKFKKSCLFVCITQTSLYAPYMDQAIVLAYHISDPG